MAQKRSRSSSGSASLSELRERARLLERIAKAEERIASARERQAAAEERVLLARRAAEQPRASTGRFLPKEAPRPQPTKVTPRVLNWKVKVPIVLESEELSAEMYNYANYSLWIVLDFDPTRNTKKFQDVLGKYRPWLQKKDPKVRWLSPKVRVSRTTQTPRAYLEPEPE